MIIISCNDQSVILLSSKSVALENDVIRKYHHKQFNKNTNPN